MARIVVLLQVRMMSTRLPEKAILLIEDKTIVEHVIDRLKAAKTPDSVVVCTSTHEDDRVLLELAEKNGVKGFAGNQDDVLDRFIKAARWDGADVVVRASGEDPLVDPVYLDKMVTHHLKTGADYTSTKQLPAGVATEVISVPALEKAHQLADNPEMSEYMTLYFKDDFFHVETLEVEESLRRPHYRLTIDTSEDLELMREIYRRLYRLGEIVALPEVVRLLDKSPELARINKKQIPRTVDRIVELRDGAPKIRIVLREQ